jgi:hypothetical protein
LIKVKKSSNLLSIIEIKQLNLYILSKNNGSLKRKCREKPCAIAAGLALKQKKNTAKTPRNWLESSSKSLI